MISTKPCFFHRNCLARNRSKASRTRRCRPPIICTDLGISFTRSASTQAWPQHGASRAPGRLGNNPEISAHSAAPSKDVSRKVPGPESKSTHQSTCAPSPNLRKKKVALPLQRIRPLLILESLHRKHIELSLPTCKRTAASQILARIQKN